MTRSTATKRIGIDTSYIETKSMRERLEQYPDLLANAKKDEDFVREVILALAKKVELNGAIDSGLRKLLGDDKAKEQKLYADFKRGIEIKDDGTIAASASPRSCKDSVRSLCDFFRLPQTEENLNRLHSTILEALQTLKNPASTDEKARESIEENLPQLLWSPTGRQAELLLQSLGYTKDTKGTLIDNKGETGFYVASFTKARFVPYTFLAGSQNRIEVPISAKLSNALANQIGGFLDQEGNQIFTNLRYDRDSGTLQFETTDPRFKSNPIAAIATAVKGVRSGPQAQSYNSRQIDERHSTRTNYLLGAVANLGMPNVVPATSYGLAWLASNIHALPVIRNVLFVGEAFNIATTSLVKFSRFVSNHNPFYTEQTRKTFADPIKRILSDTSYNEKTAISGNPFRIFSSAIIGAAGFVAGVVSRATQVTLNSIGDGLAYTAQNLLKTSEEPKANETQTLGKYLAKGGAGFLGGLAGIFRGSASVVSGVADILDTTTACLKGRTYLGKLANLSEKMKAGADNNRFFKGGDHKFVQLDVHSGPREEELFETIAGSGELTLHAQLLQALNKSKGLKFDKSSRIEGDRNVYASLAKVEIDGRYYEVLGSFDGRTITYVDLNPSGPDENKFGGEYPDHLTIQTGHAHKTSNLADFERAVSAQIKARLEDQNIKGISLEEFRTEFACAHGNSNEEQKIARGILEKEERSESVLESLKANESLHYDGYKLSKKIGEGEEGYNIEFSSTEKESGNVDLQSNAFFNFAQAMSSSEVTKNLNGSKVKNPTAVQVGRATTLDRGFGE